MNSQEYRNLQEAYLDVYQEEVLDELHRGRHGQTETEYMDSRSDAGKQISGDSKTSGAAYSHRSYKGVGKPAKPGERQETQGKMDTNTRTDILYRKAARLKKEELSLDERVLGQDPEMRRAGAKERKSGDKRLSPAAGKENANKMQRDVKFFDKLTKKNKIIPGMAHESYDLFDYIMEYLITEGYADTNESALVIMANMSEDWRESIVNENMLQSVGKAAGNVVRDVKDRVTGKKEILPGANAYVKVGGPTSKGDVKVGGIGPVGTYSRSSGSNSSPTTPQTTNTSSIRADAPQPAQRTAQITATGKEPPGDKMVKQIGNFLTGKK